jgi:hypothetical protein
LFGLVIPALRFRRFIKQRAGIGGKSGKILPNSPVHNREIISRERVERDEGPAAFLLDG